MGSNNKPVEKKGKKKGRPSLLDLQKRSLRLQKQQQQQWNPNPNPGSSIASRDANSGHQHAAADDDDEDSGGKRREKKLKLVLQLPQPSNSGQFGSGSDGDGDREIGDGGGINKAERGSSSKATDPLQGLVSVGAHAFNSRRSSFGPTTTPLPDKKLLVFILDRLQKKDTYGVYSEPVDPKELPDYFEIIDHPMDFGTVREKLSSGVYASLEQFEVDVLLISSNAMRYNAADTIYYRQARAIQELSKKSFENLRQESDDNESEPKTVVRRGRPPTKNTVSRPPAERAALDLSGAMLANAGDGTHRPNDTHGGVSTRASSLGLRNTETFNSSRDNRAIKNEESSGSALKGFSTRFGRKPIVVDENRRDTYEQPHPSINTRQPPFPTIIVGEKRQLMSVGLHMEHAYVRSLARFAANLGPVGWTIAAKKIKQALPPGTNFGRGWIGDAEAPQQSQQPLLLSSPPHPSAMPQISPCTTVPRSDKVAEKTEMASMAPYASRALPCAPTSAVSSRLMDRGLNCEAESSHLSAAANCANNQSKAAFNFPRGSGLQPVFNGYRPSLGFSLPSQTMTHGRILDMVSRGNNGFVLQSPEGQLDLGRAKSSGGYGLMNSAGSSLDSGQDSQLGWQGSSLQPKPDFVPPGLNGGFQSLRSPASGLVVDSQQQQQQQQKQQQQQQHPDLALQL